MTPEPLLSKHDPSQPPPSVWARGAVPDSDRIDSTESDTTEPEIDDTRTHVSRSESSASSLLPTDEIDLNEPVTHEINLGGATSSSAPQRQRNRRKWLTTIAVFAVGFVSGIVTKSIIDSSDTDGVVMRPRSTIPATDPSPPVRSTLLDGVAVPAVDGAEASSSNETLTVEYDSSVDATVPLGSLFPYARFVGHYGVIDPAVAPEFADVQPTTAGNLDRWLSEGAAAPLHWATRSAAPVLGRTAPIVSWRVPVVAPPQWQQSTPENAIAPGIVRRETESRVRFTVRTQDETWVEATVDKDSEAQLSDWITGLSALPTAAAATAPTGYDEVPKDAAQYGLRYTLTTDFEPTFVDLTTIQFASNLTEHESQIWMSAYGTLGQPVNDFADLGTLYPYVSESELVAGSTSHWNYVWQVNRQLFVLFRVSDEAKSSDEIARIAHAMRLSSTADSDQGVVDAPLSIYPDIASFGIGGWEQASDLNQVKNVRFGKLETDRFVYVEPASSGSREGRCGIFILGAQVSPSDCKQLSGEPDKELCVYRVDGVSGGGYRVTVLTDVEATENVSIDDANMSQLVPTDIVTTSGDSGVRPWTVASVLVPLYPTVTNDGVHCDLMG